MNEAGGTCVVTYLKKSDSAAQQVRGREVRKMRKKKKNNPADTKVSHIRRGEGAAGARSLYSPRSTQWSKNSFSACGEHHSEAGSPCSPWKTPLWSRWIHLEGSCSRFLAGTATHRRVLQKEQNMRKEWEIQTVMGNSHPPTSYNE